MVTSIDEVSRTNIRSRERRWRSCETRFDTPEIMPPFPGCWLGWTRHPMAAKDSMRFVTKKWTQSLGIPVSGFPTFTGSDCHAGPQDTPVPLHGLSAALQPSRPE